MTRSSTSNLEPFDPEIERTFRRLRNLIEDNLSLRKHVKMEETPPPVGAVGTGTAIGAVKAEDHRRTLTEYEQPSLDGTTSCIMRPAVRANNFELKPSYAQMIQNSV